MAKSYEQVMEEFGEAVNMSARELEDWLKTDESRDVGQKDGGGESEGHASGRRIVELLDKKKPDYTDDDTDHMRRVASYVHRHRAQKPKENVEDSNWRYSLINFSNATHLRLPARRHAGPEAGGGAGAGLAVRRSHPLHRAARNGNLRKLAPLRGPSVEARSNPCTLRRSGIGSGGKGSVGGDGRKRSEGEASAGA